MRLKFFPFLFFFLVLFLLLLSPKVLAQDNFLVDVAVEYKIEPGGIAKVSHTFTLENAATDLYATSYSLILDNIDPQNASAHQDGRNLSLEKTKSGDVTTLSVHFDNPVAGKGNTQKFTVTYENPSFATRTGEVWEISIPRLGQDNTFRSYSLNLVVPSSFGSEAYMSPKAVSSYKDGEWLIYSFNKSSVEKTGVTAGFGAFQVFSFTLNYHLENPLNKASSIEVAIPPDTALQRVYYLNISPKPQNIRVDEDGNWLALFSLSARERSDIQVKGAVQIFATIRPFPKPTKETLENNLKETQFWQASNVQIKELARKLQTAKSIYDYVSQNLSYDYDRVRPNVERLGAAAALESPKNAICMEYTDLFIALVRSAGIPAREVNGFAYTENPKIQPLSLVADVLHSWPEYWSEEAKSWIPVDPTWASTTGGVDYFSKLDLRHFTFVVHGQDPIKPYPPGSYKLGTNPQKDVFVSFGQLPEQRISHPEITVENQRILPFFPAKLTVTLKNPGPVALYNVEPQVFFDKELKSKNFVEVLPPYATTHFAIEVPFSFLGRNTPDSITITAADTQISVPTFKNQVIIYNLLAFFLVLAVLIIALLIRLKKIRFIKISAFFDKMTTKLKNVRKDTKNVAELPDKQKGVQ